MAKIADVIKYEGDNSTFVWKHPQEDFNDLTQLIVHENQEAIFFMNGQALDLFGAGRYTLEAQNIPQASKFLKRSTGFRSPFHCEVYFINKSEQMAVKWGTDSKVRFNEPTLGVPVEIGASGEMSLVVEDSRKLLVKLVGTMKGIAWGEEAKGFTKSLQTSFRPLISTVVKSNLSAEIKNQNIDIVEIDEHLGTLSQALKVHISKGFEEYGLTVPQFFVTTVVLPEEDTNFRKLRELHTITLQKRMAEAEADVRSTQAESRAAYMTAEAEAEAKIKAAQRGIVLEQQTTETEIARREAERRIIEAQAEVQAAQMAGMAEAAVMQAKGYTQKDILHTEVQKAYAEGIGNMEFTGGGGGSGVVGEMMGLGLGVAAMNTIAPQMGEMFKGMATQLNTTETVKCPKCNNDLPANAKFCFECGTKIEQIKENEIICPSCGNKTPKGKFCIECGYQLINKCSQCGTEIPQGAKFCPECGNKMEG